MENIFIDYLTKPFKISKDYLYLGHVLFFFCTGLNPGLIHIPLEPGQEIASILSIGIMALFAIFSGTLTS